jgi:hypothetical protein
MNRCTSFRLPWTPTTIAGWIALCFASARVWSWLFRADKHRAWSVLGPQLDRIEITPSGFGIHFPKLDADLYLPALIEGFFGSKRWMASRLGTAGGKARSAAKVLASRANGRLGGRPKKAAAS